MKTDGFHNGSVKFGGERAGRGRNTSLNSSCKDSDGNMKARLRTPIEAGKLSRMVPFNATYYLCSDCKGWHITAVEVDKS